MKTSKIWFAVGVNIFFLFCTWQSSTSCAWEENNTAMYSFFNPELSEKASYEPLYFSFDRLYSSSWADSSGLQRFETTKEWYDFAEKKVAKKDIEQVVFEYNGQQLQDLRAYTMATKRMQTTNTFVEYLVKKREVGVANYLIFARQCEKYAQIGSEWRTDDNNDADEKKSAEDIRVMKNLSKEAETQASKTTDAFLKLRYGFQAVRLAHYSNDNERAIQLYDKIVASIALDIPLKYRALGHKAGAMKRAGKDASMAAYLFAVVFDKCQTKRMNAYISFRISSDEEWKQAMQYCKSTREKTTLHFLRAIHPQNQMLEEIKNIYQLDPQSEYLSVLVVREMNKLEQQLIPTKVDYTYKKTPENLASLKSYISKLKNFIKLTIDEAKVQDQALWVMSLAYCDYMIDNSEGAKQSLRKLNVQKLSEKSKRQIEVFEAMLQVSDLQKVDASTEEKYYSLAQALKHEGVNGLLNARFAGLYKTQKEFAKEYLIYNDKNTIMLSLDNQMIEYLLQFAEKPNKSSYEKFLISKIDAKNPKKVLLDLKATILFGQNKLDEAEKILVSIGENTPLTGNPDAESLTDCHECEQANKTFTKLGLIRKIKELDAKARKGTPEVMALANFQLGNIYYNISGFGNAWRALDYYRGGMDLMMLTNFTDKTEKQSDFTTFDCKVAMAYYQKVIENAKKYKNKELAAKATFMAAKCEQTEYYMSSEARKREQWTNGSITFDPKYRTNFKSLRENYAGTKFYQKAIAECSYFKTYVRLK